MTMHRIVCALLVLFTTSTALSYQSAWRSWRNYRNSYYPFGWDGGAASSTSLQAQGMAELIRAQGEYQQAHAQALLTMEEVRRQESQRRAEQRQAFQEMRAAQFAERRDRRQQRSAARTNALAGENADQFPETLTSSEIDPVTGTIQWPAIYQQEMFNATRTELDAMAAAWANPTSDKKLDPAKVDAVVHKMHEALRTLIEKIPTAQYLSAMNYLDRLDLTLRMPPQGPGKP